MLMFALRTLLLGIDTFMFCIGCLRLAMDPLISTVINKNLFICAVAVCSTALYLFGTDTFRDAQPSAGEAPVRQQFFAHHYKHLLALIYDECIICRDEPTAPVQVQPCGHIFCHEHIQEWFDRGNRRCPQCTRELFVEAHSKLEILSKLSVAMTHLNLIITSGLLLLAKDLSRISVVLGTLVLVFGVRALTKFRRDRKRHGGRWWRRWGEQTPGDDEAQEDFVLATAMLMFGWLWWTMRYLRA
ncbi:hypothetical protein LTR85_011299 [Meristemomyces frigidus]|nr:hypothetical protein LTR85_011299 [Meristemomyces frigidus]